MEPRQYKRRKAAAEGYNGYVSVKLEEKNRAVRIPPSNIFNHIL